MDIKVEEKKYKLYLYDVNDEYNCLKEWFETVIKPAVGDIIYYGDSVYKDYYKVVSIAIPLPNDDNSLDVAVKKITNWK